MKKIVSIIIILAIASSLYLTNFALRQPEKKNSRASASTPVLTLETKKADKTYPYYSFLHGKLKENSSQFSYIWPAKGTITSGYGMRRGRMHKGIDIAAPIGTPILAAAGGEVISAGWNSGGFGNLVKIKHPDGNMTLYAHNHRILVAQGQEVRQGQQIAEMGSTGRSSGPHLHFEIHLNGRSAVNPIFYLPRY